MIYKCIIVDDEQHAIQLISDYIQETPRLQLANTYQNSAEVLSQLQQEDEIDIAFIDIHMPGISGIELIPHLKSLVKHIVIVSGYPEFGVKAFELQVSDFLLKPFTIKSFNRSIDKIVTYSEKVLQTVVQTNFYIRVVGDQPKWINCDLDLVKVIESDRNYIKVTVSEQQYLAHGSIREMEESLPKNLFIRIHRSFIIAKSHIEYIENNIVKITDKKEPIPIGRSYRQDLYDYMNNLVLLKKN